MTVEETIDKLKDARDKIAEVYEKQATDEIPDNGNLSMMNDAISRLNNVIAELQP